MVFQVFDASHWEKTSTRFTVQSLAQTKNRSQTTFPKTCLLRQWRTNPSLFSRTTLPAGKFSLCLHIILRNHGLFDRWTMAWTYHNITSFWRSSYVWPGDLQNVDLLQSKPAIPHHILQLLQQYVLPMQHAGKVDGDATHIPYS